MYLVSNPAKEGDIPYLTYPNNLLIYSIFPIFLSYNAAGTAKNPHERAPSIQTEREIGIGIYVAYLGIHPVGSVFKWRYRCVWKRMKDDDFLWRNKRGGGGRGKGISRS